jgi:predicted acetyltransferase
MDIRIALATLADYPVIQNMARFYVYDLSSECGFISSDWAIPADGLYESFDFKDYFQDVDRRAFLINVDDEIAGFILLNQKGILPKTEWNMGEFFILAKFQDKGIGSKAAQQIWSDHPGRWEISVIPENKNAANFWRRVILSYS